MFAISDDVMEPGGLSVRSLSQSRTTSRVGGGSRWTAGFSFASAALDNSSPEANKLISCSALRRATRLPRPARRRGHREESLKQLDRLGPTARATSVSQSRSDPMNPSEPYRSSARASAVH
jgi:hypothetical protein